VGLRGANLAPTLSNGSRKELQLKSKPGLPFLAYDMGGGRRWRMMPRESVPVGDPLWVILRPVIGTVAMAYFGWLLGWINTTPLFAREVEVSGAGDGEQGA